MRMTENPAISETQRMFVPEAIERGRWADGSIAANSVGGLKGNGRSL